MSIDTKATRRTFFAGLGAVAAAGVAAKLASKPADAPAEEAKPADPGGSGYRLSEHIKKYYRTAKL
ncbi:hypothetical protein [Massilia endophytica]|uniref:hypothetical protein n=1 Tax=Massilia endophytica TaxID=2899220 RepID=UPI001E450034|nr:hypothetical protein [Massilia endophytica]UGQ48107.1 hypothetical protein LSQ66_06465 [Massilia endophytica]